MSEKNNKFKSILSSIKKYFTSWSRKKVIILVSACFALLLLILGLCWFFLGRNDKNTCKVKFYNQQNQVIKEIRVQKNTKITDQAALKTSFESLNNPNRWSLQASNQIDSNNRVNDFCPLYETVNSDLNLYPSSLSSNQKLVTFNSKVGSKIKALVVDRGIESDQLKNKLDILEKPTSQQHNFCGWFRFKFGGESILEAYPFGSQEERNQRILNKIASNQINEDLVLHAYLEPKNSLTITYSDDQTKKTFSKVDVEHINPFTWDKSTQHSVLSLLIDDFVNIEIDWQKAIKDGYASFPHDFSKFSQEPNEPGKRIPGTTGTLSTDVLKPQFVSNLLAKLPEHPDLTGLSGNDYYEKSKEIEFNKMSFTFKDGLTFQNGEPINAHTLKYTIEKQIDPQSKNLRADNVFETEYLNLKNAKKYFEQTPENPVNFDEVGIKVIDPLTFELEFENNKSLYHIIQRLNGIILVPPKAYDAAFQNPEQTQNSYGTKEHPFQSYGAYIIKEWSPNQKFIFNKNYSHFDKQKVSSKAISIRVVSEQSTSENMFKDKKLNSLDLNTPELFQEYKNDPSIKISPGSGRKLLVINQDKRDDQKPIHPILKDLDFRKACFFAINRNDINSTVDVFQDGSLSFLPTNTSLFDEPFIPGYNSSQQHQKNIQTFKPEVKGYDPIKAFQLFKQAYDRLSPNDKKEPIELEFLLMKTKIQEVALANYLKNQFENCFNQEGEKIKITLNIIENSKIFYPQYACPYNFNFLFHPVIGFDIAGYFFCLLDLEEPAWCFGSGGYDFKNKEVTFDFSSLKRDLDSKKDSISWYQMFTKGFKEQDNVIPGVNQEGKWTGTLKQFKIFFEKTLKKPANYSSCKQTTLLHIFDLLEKLLFDNMACIPISTIKEATVYKDMLFRWPNYSLYWGYGPGFYSNLTSDPDYKS
ncbi:ABC transporter substrate-binding protein [Candidatus Phytoplasma solani]|uniref:ABC transporter substrate-binding protein n=1 Tax=Candidatus Phytoplasma solani TaxID=69896 RepID=UPI00358F1BC6